MNRALAPLLVSALFAAAPAPGGSPAAPETREAANVAAFARLWGVVGYFYPADDVGEIDWSRFAVVGVKRVRTARDVAALRTALESLFSPLGPGIVVGPPLPERQAAPAPSAPLVAVRSLGPGFTGAVKLTPFAVKRTNREGRSPIREFVAYAQTVPAESLRGRTIRLRGSIRTRGTPDAFGFVGVRVDRPGDAKGFFDNGANRPVRGKTWREAVIEGPVAEDAVRVVLAVWASGSGDVDFDALAFESRAGTEGWRPEALGNPGFESDPEKTKGWHRTGVDTRATATWEKGGAAEGERFLRISSPVLTDPLFPGAEPRAGDVATFDLGQGLVARVPLALSDAEARSSPSRAEALAALRKEIDAVRRPADPADPDVRLADTLVVWSVLRHFYPYFAEAAVDWDARLLPQLAAASSPASRAVERDSLRRQMAEVRDGHANVFDQFVPERRMSLPVALDVVEGRVAIRASGDPAHARVGAEVVAIDGIPAREFLAKTSALCSGSTQWRESSGLIEMVTGPEGAEARLTLEDGSGRRDVTLRYAGAPPQDLRPAPLAELEPGLWYVDLTRADGNALGAKLPAIAAGRGVVFDLRGYPAASDVAFLSNLLDAPEEDPWMHIPRITGPFGRLEGYSDLRWSLKPRPPRIAGNVVFLTDTRAISASESILGYVKDRKLGTIVGRTTAGTNGNVAWFQTPGGYSVSFTGMRVTRHDGRRPFHLLGVEPDVPSSPTLSGLRAGRDEVLETGLTIARGTGPAPR